MTSFDENWEATYRNSAGKHLNKYPYGQLVTYFFRNLKHLPINEETRILELGCGTGNNLPLILNENIKAVGIDGSASAIDYARERFADNPNCELKVMDFTNIDYPDNTFDMIIDRQSIYANRPEAITRIYQELQRVIKPEGIFLSFMYNVSDYHLQRILADGSYATEIGNNTYTDFRGGTFEGNGTVHFFTREEVIRLCGENRFDIVSLAENQIDEILPNQTNRLSEYILVARRQAS